MVRQEQGQPSLAQRKASLGLPPPLPQSEVTLGESSVHFRPCTKGGAGHGLSETFRSEERPCPVSPRRAVRIENGLMRVIMILDERWRVRGGA